MYIFLFGLSTTLEWCESIIGGQLVEGPCINDWYYAIVVSREESLDLQEDICRSRDLSFHLVLCEKQNQKIKWKYKGSVQAQVRPWDAAYVYEALWTGRSKILFYICPILNATFISSSSTETHHFHHFSWISYLIITFFAASTAKWCLQAVQYTKKDKFDSIVKFLSARFYLKPVIEKGAFW